MSKPVILKDYQDKAAREILATLDRSRSDWRTHGEQSTFALSSTTGSGKTIIAAAVIEALLRGSTEFDDMALDPTAVVLWVSHEPTLNEQTRSRFIEVAQKIATSDLVLLDKSFTGQSLETGQVYFINPQKLRDGAGFVKHTDERNVTFWEILDNTISDPDKTLYMVLDEAHEGMKNLSDGDQTLVQRIINGNGANPSMPVVWGISATIRRFNRVMEKADNFTKRPNITIDAERVQASGLLKHALTLDIPDEDGDFETTMIRDAALDFVDLCQRWDVYCQEQNIERPVKPLMVVQIPDRRDGELGAGKGEAAEDQIIHRVLEPIRRHWPDMPEDCVAHVLGDRGTIEVGKYSIPKVKPQDVEGEHQIRVLIAKEAVTTGWDCPRAEVLVSLRPGRSHTHVTQLLGRMVRTPLAQTTSVDRLNSVSCYLPRFDREMAKVVAEEIMGLREPAEGKTGVAVATVLFNPVTVRWNHLVPQQVKSLIEALPSLQKPAQMPRPIPRVLLAAQAFAQDKIVPPANAQAFEAIFAVIDAFVGRHRPEIEKIAAEIMTADIRRLTVDRDSAEVESESLQRAADAATVEDALRHVRRLLTPAVVTGYLARDASAAINAAVEAGEDPSQVDLTTMRAQVAALGLIEPDDDEVPLQRQVEDVAETLTKLWLGTHVPAIEALPDARQAAYERVRQMARGPEDVGVRIKDEDQVDTVDMNAVVQPVAPKHILADVEGNYPMTGLNRWERAVLAHEVAEESVVAWYRNPSAGRAALQIAYEGHGTWRSVQPDIIVVSDVDGQFKPSIIDPHGAHLGDSSPKLKALAEYAVDHGTHFDRILAIGVESADGTLSAIDLKATKVQRAVFEASGDSEAIKAIYTQYGRKYTRITD